MGTSSEVDFIVQIAYSRLLLSYVAGTRKMVDLYYSASKNNITKYLIADVPWEEED